jgi:tetratricopeptide (TPR) repeat protein
MRKLSSPKFFLPFVLLLLAVFLTYANCFSNQFLFDDEFLIIRNSFLRQWSTFFEIFSASSTTGAGGVDSFYRPLQTVCYLLVYQIFGLSPLGYHLLNVGLHACNALLTAVLGVRLGFRRDAVIFAALLWALHPVHTEAVTYMSATADTLYAFFCLLGCVILLPSFTKWRVASALAAFFCGLLSKEAALVFPALAIAVRLATAEKKWSWRTYAFTLPFWFLAGFYLVARKTFLNFDDTFTFFKSANIYSENFLVRLSTFFATVPAYLSLLVWPTGLHMERNFPVFASPLFAPVIAGAVLVAATLFQVGLARGRWGVALSFGFLWFWAAHAPHTGVLIPVNSLFLEHWLYLPTAGLFLGVAQSVGSLLERASPVWRLTLTRLTAGFAILCVVFLGMKTRAQNEVWASPVSFYTNILEHNPKAVRAHNNLAMAYSDLHQLDKAMEHYLKGIEISDEYAQTHYNLALLYFEKNEPAQAVIHLRRAVVINPNFYYAYGRLHDYYLAQGLKEEAATARREFQAARKRMGFND